MEVILPVCLLRTVPVLTGRRLHFKTGQCQGLRNGPAAHPREQRENFIASKEFPGHNANSRRMLRITAGYWQWARMAVAPND